MSKSTGNESDDCQNDLRKATELSICDLAVSIFYNVGRRASRNKKTMTKGKTMVDGNKRNLIDEDKEKSYQNVISSSLRNNQNNVYLPPSFKKRQFYDWT